MQSVIHVRDQEEGGNYVYIGRPSIWGNPYIVGMDGTRRQVLEKYRDYILQHKELLARLPELKNKTLVCWCKPSICHGDVLVEILSGY